MFNVIYCEFAKLRRSYYYLLLLGVILFFPAMLFIGWLGQGATVNWNDFMIQIEQLSAMFITLPLLAITGAYIFTREYSSNTAQVLFTYPSARTKIFMAKFIVVILISSIAVLLHIIFGFISGLLLPHEPLTLDIFLGHLRLNCYMLVYEIALLPVAVLISILCKNVILPMVFSGLAAVSSAMVMGIRDLRGIEAIHQYLPTLYALDIFDYSFKGKGDTLVLVKSGVYLSGAPNFVAATLFILGIALCLYFYNKADID